MVNNIKTLIIKYTIKKKKKIDNFPLHEFNLNII